MDPLETCCKEFPAVSWQKRQNQGYFQTKQTLCRAWNTADLVIFPKTSCFVKVSFFVQCIRKQLITLQNFNIQICFSSFLSFFNLKFWFKGQIISRIHLMHTNLCVLIEISMKIGMLNFWSVIICLCNEAWNSLYQRKEAISQNLVNKVLNKPTPKLDNQLTVEKFKLLLINLIFSDEH